LGTSERRTGSGSCWIVGFGLVLLIASCVPAPDVDPTPTPTRTRPTRAATPSDPAVPAPTASLDPRDIRFGARVLRMPEGGVLPPERDTIVLCTQCPSERLLFRELAPPPIPMPDALDARCPGIATIDERAFVDRPTGSALRAVEVTTEVVTFPGEGGVTIPAFLSRPADGARYPGIVYVHGGLAEPAAEEPGRTIAAAGFVVLTPGYRGTLLSGMSEDQALRSSDLAHGDVEDVFAGAEWLREQGETTGRFAVFGTSLGGGIVNVLAYRYPGAWDAVVDFYGVSDWACVTKILTYGTEGARLIGTAFGGAPEDAVDEYRAGSPIYHADGITAPYYIGHGLLDITLPPGESQKWVEALRAAGVEVEWRPYGGESHGFLFHYTFESPVWQDVFAWLHRELD
jgi:dienelactone hydrolase